MYTVVECLVLNCERSYSIASQHTAKNSSVNHFLWGPSEGVSTLDVANFIDLIGDLDKCITTQGNS